MREFTHRVLITGKRCNLGFLMVYLICKPPPCAPCRRVWLCLIISDIIFTTKQESNDEVCDSVSVNSIIFKSKKIGHCRMIEKDAMRAIRGAEILNACGKMVIYEAAYSGDGDMQKRRRGLAFEAGWGKN